MEQVLAAGRGSFLPRVGRLVLLTVTHPELEVVVLFDVTEPPHALASCLCSELHLTEDAHHRRCALLKGLRHAKQAFLDQFFVDDQLGWPRIDQGDE